MIHVRTHARKMTSVTWKVSIHQGKTIPQYCNVYVLRLSLSVWSYRYLQYLILDSIDICYVKVLMVVCVKVLVQAVLGWSWYSCWWQAQLQYLERDCERCQHQAAVGGAEAPEQHSHQQYSLYSYTIYSKYKRVHSAAPSVGVPRGLRVRLELPHLPPDREHLQPHHQLGLGHQVHRLAAAN